jgi:Fic family protein
VPDRIADLDLELPGAAAHEVAAAQAALAAFAASPAVPSLEAIAATLLRAEAVGSSHIEGHRVSNRRLAIAAYAPRVGDDTALTVLGNVRAMAAAVDIGSRPSPLHLRDLLGTHRTLLEHSTQARFAGKLRDVQNWIGGRSFSPRDADFIPPPPEEVSPLMEDLVAFCNRTDLPVIAQAAVAHAQFETIHPFADGNGRAGRCLIHVVMRRRGISHVVPPISVVLANDAAAYVAGLTDYRAGRVADWVGRFAAAVGASVRAAELLGARLRDLTAALIEQAGTLRRDAVARRIVESLPSTPVVSAETVARSQSVTPTSARRALNQLTEAGVLQLTRVGRRRDREWSCDALFDLLDAFELGLAEPAAGGSSRRAPSRHRMRQPTRAR